MKTLQLIITVTLCIILSSIMLLQHANASVDARPSGIVPIDLKLDKESYFSGDSVFVNGKFWLINATQVTIGIEKNHNLIVATKNVTVSENKTFSASFIIPKDVDAKSWSIVVTASSGTLIQDLNFYPVPLTPLKQFKGGIISILDVKCMHGFDRLVKTSDGSPACVKPLSGKILMERGWATRTIKVKNTDFEINYAITGGKLTGATEDLYPQELILSLQTSSDGYLTVNIPKGLINLRNIDYWTDGTIHVSANHKEINFKQYKSLGYVVITVALKSGMTQVEISSGIPGAIEEGK